MAADKDLKFEEALEKLEECCNKLRSGELSLEESALVYSNSVMYYNKCVELLKAAKQKIEIFRPESGVTEDF